MSFRSRLIRVGVGPLVLIGLLTFVVQAFRLGEANGWNEVSETAQSIQRAVGELRRGEKDFLLRDRRNPEFLAAGRSVNLDRVDEAVRSIESHLTTLMANSRTRSDPRLPRMSQDIREYANRFQELKKNILRMGSENSGLEREWHAALARIRNGLVDRPDLRPQVDQIEIAMLHYLLRFDPAELVRVLDQLERFRADAGGATLALDAARDVLLEYRVLVERNGVNERQGLQGEFRAAIHRLGDSLGDLIGEARLRAHSAHLSTFNASLVMLGVSLVGAALVMAYVARGVVKPLRHLTTAANRLRSGDLDLQFPGSDVTELRELSDAFRAMSDSLQDARRDLEAKVEARTRDLEEAKGGLEERNHQLGFLVAELRRTAEESSRLAREAAAANEAKSRFLAVMSHELRTPINGMLGFSDFLAESDLSPEQREQVHIIRDSANHLLAIVNDILDISRIEQGRMDVRVETVDLLPLAREVVGLQRSVAAVKGVACVLECPERKMGVQGDPVRLRQILLNLTGNAVKFTDCGEVRLLVDEVDGDVRVRVVDTGPGIPQASIPTLFQKFVQVDASHSRRHGGVGLGLAISKALVEQMGGTIGLESEVGRGSTFWFRLPRAVGATDGVPASLNTPSGLGGPRPSPDPIGAVSTPRCPEILEANDSTPVGRSRRRVLIAEDHPTNARLVTRFVQLLGMDPAVVADGLHLLEAFSHGDWDLLVVDWQMPGMDGLDAVRRIRSLGTAGARVPILLMTANAMPGDSETCLRAGADACLLKPVRRGDFDRAVNSLLQPDRVPRNTASRQLAVAD